MASSKPVLSLVAGDEYKSIWGMERLNIKIEITGASVERRCCTFKVQCRHKFLVRSPGPLEVYVCHDQSIVDGPSGRNCASISIDSISLGGGMAAALVTDLLWKQQSHKYVDMFVMNVCLAVGGTIQMFHGKPSKHALVRLEDVAYDPEGGRIFAQIYADVMEGRLPSIEEFRLWGIPYSSRYGRHDSNIQRLSVAPPVASGRPQLPGPPVTQD